MKRTISVMVGRGSVNHNSRKFHAKNTDPTRTHLNIDYCHDDIKAIYHELFDDALQRYNDKQTKADRKIADYYEKIRSGKQEKSLMREVRDYERLRRTLGPEQADMMLEAARQQEQTEKERKRAARRKADLGAR